MEWGRLTAAGRPGKTARRRCHLESMSVALLGNRKMAQSSSETYATGAIPLGDLFFHFQVSGFEKVAWRRTEGRRKGQGGRAEGRRLRSQWPQVLPTLCLCITPMTSAGSAWRGLVSVARSGCHHCQHPGRLKSGIRQTLSPAHSPKGPQALEAPSLLGRGQRAEGRRKVACGFKTR